MLGQLFQNRHPITHKPVTQMQIRQLGINIHPVRVKGKRMRINSHRNPKHLLGLVRLGGCQVFIRCLTPPAMFKTQLRYLDTQARIPWILFSPVAVLSQNLLK